MYPACKFRMTHKFNDSNRERSLPLNIITRQYHEKRESPVVLPRDWIPLSRHM